MKVTLTKVYRTDKDKNGNTLKSAQGKPYTRLSIKTSEHGDKWLSGFENKQTSDWKEGDEVEINVKENGQYLNFEVPKKDAVNMEGVERALAFINDNMNAVLTEQRMIRTSIEDMYKYLTTHKVMVGGDGNYPHPTPSQQKMIDEGKDNFDNVNVKPVVRPQMAATVNVPVDEPEYDSEPF